ncbi:DRIM down-regulated in metastasis family protein [Nitzschia inconspicua]|uniref:DRIM down-regulated in metastasis family protein n=1 Tax=Nitzschia inconspicua TaxID=303405 RepID=A0A9K3PVB8_9STRA|nr:DRIM down-regulated in metastasis family protein [Nitzschia inconspicua]
MKSVNLDSRSKKRIRYASAKERSKKASADVYRSYKDRIAGGVTSASTRERFVHNPQSQQRPHKRQRRHQTHGIENETFSKDRSKTAVVRMSEETDDFDVRTNGGKNDDGLKLEEILDEQPEKEQMESSTFAAELDLAIERNASEIFGKFHRQIWLLVRSLPELLHNLSKVVDILMSYMLSPISLPERPTPISDSKVAGDGKCARQEFSVNLATTDILHLLSVLARDLRHEIHPYLHSKILPRIIIDLLNPPPPPPGSDKQPIPLDVTIVEAAFRCIAYIFKYDSKMVVNDMESMRQYYGMTLGNRRELIRRLSAETFAPLIRKMKNRKAKERHVRRVLRALAATSQQPLSRIFERTQMDAVDGLSQLCFQISRGVSGKLHSDGAAMVRYLFELVESGSNDDGGETTATEEVVGQDLIFDVVSGMLDKLCYHCNKSTFGAVSNELFSAFHSFIFKCVDDFEVAKSALPIIKYLKLIVKAATKRSGSLFEEHSDKDLRPLCASLTRLCSETVFAPLSQRAQPVILELLCELWVSFQDRKCMGISEKSENILKCKAGTKDFSSFASIIMAKKLLPLLRDEEIRDKVSSLLVGAASDMAKDHSDRCLEVIFAVATSTSVDSSSDSDDCFSLFPVFSGDQDIVSLEQQASILDACIMSCVVVPETLGRVSVALRCVPFLVTARPTDVKDNFKRAAKWVTRILADQNSSLLIKALAVECFASLSLRVLDLDVEQSTVKKMMLGSVPLAVEMLIRNSESLWANRAVASLIPLFERFALQICDDIDGLFDALIPNLRRSNHFLRLYTLRILASFPSKSYVVDHADLDFSKDLDEEESFRPSGEQKRLGKGLVGPCHLLDILLELEASQVSLVREKELLSLVGKVEVIVRSGRLPVAYAEAACNHMLGLFHVKFAPLWAGAQKTITTLLDEYEALVWSTFEAELVAVVKDVYVAEKEAEVEKENDLYIFEKHLLLCQAWEQSAGNDIRLFGEKEVEDGVVSRSHATDAVTVMESVWKAAEMSHKVVVKHSRVIVPLFLNFLHAGLFPSQQNEHGARELHLEEVVENEDSRVHVPGFIIQKQLKSFLSVFAAIDGPQQLIHHTILEKVFRSLLAHQDMKVVELALSCLAKYKHASLVRYRVMITALLQKGKLRNALLDLTEEVNSGRMSREERIQLIPVLSSILFGRVSAKSGKSSSKDSPVARRAAVLSFLSVLCQDDSDLFPFLYLMTRSFIPDTVEISTVESMLEEDQGSLMQSLLTVRSDELFVSGPVVEGFLHLLESVISQLGYRIVHWIPQLTSVTIELCKLVAINSGTEAKISHDARQSHDEKSNGGETLRRGAVRTLCFQRLSDLFTRFASAVDFNQFSARFWDAVSPSLHYLPEMVVRSQDCPAFLTLLRSLSEHDELLDILVANDFVVGVVVECIAPTSFHSVMHSSLAFVENLLTETNEDLPSKGQILVRKFAPKLVMQFTKRLEGGETNDVPEASKGNVNRGLGTRSPTWRRELQLLYRVSDFVSDTIRDENAHSYVGNLCGLLVPYLGPDQGTTDEDKTNIIGILSSISPRLDSNTAFTVFVNLSSTLSPYKSKAGITSLSVRQGIAHLINKIAPKNPWLERVSSLLVQISSTDRKRLDELDFEVVIPALNSLARQEGDSLWKTLCDQCDSLPSDLIPLINCCFHYLHNEDGVISRASFSGLRELVFTAAELSQNMGESSDGWMKLVESAVVPSARRGLESRDGQVRRYCTLLVREITKCFQDSSSTYVCSDLWRFCDEENSDLDFFLGVTHVQIHRRARAFRRLRKTLTDATESQNEPSLSSQSLVNVLIPLTLHPLYESKTASEEGLALEAIATLGALSRQLSWSKYNNILWSLLTQFDRHPDQERYLVGAMCAMIDSFHFELFVHGETNGNEDPQTKTSVCRSLENRIIPKMESIVTKESTDKSGNRIKSLRPSIILALTKLFQKFPESYFESKLSNIFAVICDVLRSRDSNSRDVARTTLSKIVCSIDLKYLGDVVRELAVSLTEGYKLHVRAATLHTILLELNNLNESALIISGASSTLPFDRCIPAMMDLLQEDLFGEANERRESQETSVRYVKEAGGNKSVHSVEMISKMLIFSPSENRTSSSVHCVITPFLERLRMPDVDARMIRKIREVLSRIVVGLSNNKSVKGEELLPFVHATILPFISQDAIDSVKDGTELANHIEEDDENAVNISISGSRTSLRRTKVAAENKSGSVVEWRPSTLKTSESEKSAKGIKKHAQQNLRSVQDGYNAPKLTGSSRHGPVQLFGSEAVNEPAATSAVIFGLNLLSASQKKNGIFGRDLLHMLDPFIPILTALVCHCRNTDIALLALKCLQNFLHFDLPSVASCSKSLGSQTLHLLSSSSSTSNQSDLTQACFKTLTHLINNDSDVEKGKTRNGLTSGEKVLVNRSKMPLDPEQMKILCSLLQISIAETEQHNPALNLVKAIMSHRYISPEFYDLMDAILKLVVRSPKPTLRQQGAVVFVRYLLDYPMGEDRFEQHLKQVIANISYEYQEGRTSAVALLSLIIEKLPPELLEKHAQMLFLPLVMQFLNDDSKDCRLKVADCIKLLFARCSSQLLRTFQDYCMRWSKQDGPLRLASLQVVGLLVESQPGFLRSGSMIDAWVHIIQNNLRNRQSMEWETTYFSLLCLEKLFGDFLSVLCEHSDLWPCISDCLVDDHPWVKMSSSRILNRLFSTDFADSGILVCTKSTGLLFEVVRNLCSQLNVTEGDQNEDLSDLGTKTLTQVLPLMKERPQLCFKDDGNDSDSETNHSRDPVFWLMRRLSQISKNKGRKRRLAVFKCYAAFSAHHFSVVAPHLELMLEGLHRVIVEGKNETDNQAFSQKKPRKSMPSTHGDKTDPLASSTDEYTMAEEVMRLLEESCSSPEEFLTAYASVKRRARDKKDKRKSEEKAQAVLDPKAFAERKIQKQVRSKERRKRRVQEQRQERGGVVKRRRS